MNRRFFSPRLVAVAMLALGGLGGCSNQGGGPPGPATASEPVVIGALYNQTGPQIFFDVPSLNGARMAVAEINRAGGVLGRQLDLVVEDGESDQGLISVKTLGIINARPAVAAFMGLSDPDMTIAAAPVAAAGGRLFITSGATDPNLVNEVPAYLFLACFGDNVQSAALAEWAHENGIESVAVIYSDAETYPVRLRNYFETRFKQLGGTIVSSEALSSIGAAAGPISRMRPADAVLLAVETAAEAIEIIPHIRASGFSGPILGGDGYDGPTQWAQHPGISDVVFATHVYLGDDASEAKPAAFREAYKKAYPGQNPTAFSALGYDTVYLLRAAISNAGNTDPDAVREALGKVQGFAGITGTIGYEPGDRIPRKSVSILAVAGGRTRFVAQISPKQVPAP